MTKPSSLFLYPVTTSPKAWDHAALVKHLTAIGLTGEKINHQNFFAGEQLLNLITFAGCSPHLEFRPSGDTDRDYCHVTIHGPTDEKLVFISQMARARCPACQKKVSVDALELGGHATIDSAIKINCPKCGVLSNLIDWQWKRYAAIANALVEIHSVFPNEAMPSVQLMDALYKATGEDWQYAWADSS